MFDTPHHFITREVDAIMERGDDATGALWRLWEQHRARNADTFAIVLIGNLAAQAALRKLKREAAE